jgi:uncharacterized membrane protein YecN with MAPEG domain
MNALTDMTAAQAAALWSGLLLLLMVVLAIRVILSRRANRVLLGDGGNADVQLVGRVFGNASEYIPVGVGALAVLTLLGIPGLAIHILGAMLFAGRVIHALSLRNRKPTVGRVIGMLLTLFALLGSGAMLVVHAFVGVPHG